MTETYDNDDHFDITYIIIVWVAFLPTLIVPWFVAHWILIGAFGDVRQYVRRSSSNGSQVRAWDCSLKAFYFCLCRHVEKKTQVGGAVRFIFPAQYAFLSTLDQVQ